MPIEGQPGHLEVRVLTRAEDDAYIASLPPMTDAEKAEAAAVLDRLIRFSEASR